MENTVKGTIFICPLTEVLNTTLANKMFTFYILQLTAQYFAITGLDKGSTVPAEVESFRCNPNIDRRGLMGLLVETNI